MPVRLNVVPYELLAFYLLDRTSLTSRVLALGTRPMESYVMMLDYVTRVSTEFIEFRYQCMLALHKRPLLPIHSLHHLTYPQDPNQPASLVAAKLLEPARQKQVSQPAPLCST